MIIYSQIVRASDGLPLSASTDFSNEVNQSIKDNKKYVKMLAYKLANLPEKCILHLGEITLYLLTCLGVSYIVMTEHQYPPPLAFCFLKELMTNFAQRYDTIKIKQAKRPYEFIEYDDFIHKTRQSFNKSQGLTTKINFSDVELELKLQRPYTLSLSDIEPVRNGFRIIQNTQLGVGPPPKLEPISVFAWVTILLATLLILLGIYRGISALQVSNLEEFDGPSPIHGILFLVESILKAFQVYLLLYNSKYRTVQSWSCAVILLLCIFFLWELRDPSQHAVFVVSTLLTLSATHCRQLQPILPNYHV